MAAAAWAGLSHHGGQSDVLEESGDRVSVARGRGAAAGGLGIEVEGEEVEVTAVISEVDGPGAIGLGAADVVLARVLIEYVAVGVARGHAHARPRAQGASEPPRRTALGAYVCTDACCCYDGVTSVSRVGTTKAPA